MQIEVSLNTVPPAVELVDPDDFKAFKVVVNGAEHSWVDPAALVALAGARGEDPAWRDGLEKMITFAAGHGWTNDEGQIRAHVEAGA